MEQQKNPENNKSKQLSRRDFLKTGGAVIASAAVFGSLAACSPKTTTATTIQTATTTLTTTQIPKKYQIGVIASLTGWLGSFNVLALQIAQIGAGILNKTGFVVGSDLYNIELVVEDGQSTATGCSAAANKLIFSDGVKFFLGPDAFLGSAVSGLCEQNKIMHILGMCTMQPGEMDATTTWSFLGGAAVIEPFFILMPYLQENYPKVKTVCIVQADDGAIPYIQPVVFNALQSAGYTIKGSIIGYDNSATDYSSYAARAVATGADCCIAISGLAPSYGSILKGIRSLGSDMLYAVAGNTDILNFAATAGASSVSNCFDAAYDNDPPDETPLQKEINAQIASNIGSSSSQVYELANPVYEFTQLFQKANSFDPVAVKAAFESSTTIENWYGTCQIGGLKTYGIKHAVTPRMPIFTFDGKGNPVFQKYESIALP